MLNGCVQGSLEALPRPPAKPGDALYEDLADTAIPLGLPTPYSSSDDIKKEAGSGAGSAPAAKPPQPLDFLVPPETRVVAVTGVALRPKLIRRCISSARGIR